ncbi:MAG: YdeI/OmpD-associated family protein [Candidatus Dormiibacterota bacterium]
MTGQEEEPTLQFATPDELVSWLATNHATRAGLRIRFAKKATGVRSITHEEALLVALRFGWIDGRVERGPEGYFRQRFTPRRAGSRWSKRNCELAEGLLERGEMAAAGRREVDAAKLDGRWAAAYEGPRRASVPDDLQRELNRDPAAAAFFATLTSQNRYAILYRLEEAKRPETRARRLAKFIDMLRRGETLH